MVPSKNKIMNLSKGVVVADGWCKWPVSVAQRVLVATRLLAAVAQYRINFDDRSNEDIVQFLIC